MSAPPPLKIVLHDHTGEERRVLRRERRQARELHRADGDRQGTTSTLLLRDAVEPGGYVIRTSGPWARLLARLLAPWLDGRLASGTAPESGPLLAARAERLTSAPGRWAVAQDWRDLLRQASRPVPLRDPRVPLCRDRIIAAEGELRSMLAALSVPLPVPARRRRHGQPVAQRRRRAPLQPRLHHRPRPRSAGGGRKPRSGHAAGRRSVTHGRVREAVLHGFAAVVTHPDARVTGPLPAPTGSAGVSRP